MTMGGCFIAIFKDRRVGEFQKSRYTPKTWYTVNSKHQTIYWSVLLLQPARVKMTRSSGVTVHWSERRSRIENGNRWKCYEIRLCENRESKITPTILWLLRGY